MSVISSVAHVGAVSVPSRGPVHHVARRAWRRPRFRTSLGRSVFPAVSVVVPSRNEARNLEVVLPTIAAVRPAVHEMIVVDGHSTDDSIAAARRALPWARVIRQTRRGKGNAMACGFAAATGDVIVMLDADGSADPAEIPAFVAALIGGADFAKGTRFTTGGGQRRHHPLRRTGNAGLNRHRQHPVRHRATPTCATATTRSGPTCCLRCSCPITPGPGPRHDLGRRLRDRNAAQPAGSPRPGCGSPRSPRVERRRLYGRTNLRTFADGARVLRTLFAEHRRAARLSQSGAPPAARRGPGVTACARDSPPGRERGDLRLHARAMGRHRRGGRSRCGHRTSPPRSSSSSTTTPRSSPAPGARFPGHVRVLRNAIGEDCPGAGTPRCPPRPARSSSSSTTTRPPDRDGFARCSRHTPTRTWLRSAGWRIRAGRGGAPAPSPRAARTRAASWTGSSGALTRASRAGVPRCAT